MMSVEKLTEIANSFASIEDGELIGRLPEAQRQGWLDTLAAVTPKTEQEAADILDDFGAFLLEEPLEGVEDTIKRKKPKPVKGEVAVQSPLERKAEKQRNKMKAKGKYSTAEKQTELLAIFSGDGAVEAKDANEAKCLGALVREEYLTASLYAAICDTADIDGQCYLVEQQAIKLQALVTN